MKWVFAFCVSLGLKLKFTAIYWVWGWAIGETSRIYIPYFYQVADEVAVGDVCQRRGRGGLALVTGHWTAGRLTAQQNPPCVTPQFRLVYRRREILGFRAKP